MTDELEDEIISKTEGYLDKHETDKAVQSADDLSMIDSKDAIVWYLKGKVHYMMGEYDDALASLAKAATIEAQKPDTWLVMGYTLIALRRYSEAKPSLEYVVAVQPENIEAHAALSILETILGNSNSAQTHLQSAVELNKSTTSKMMDYFYRKYFAESKSVSPQVKQEIESKLKSLSV